MLFPLLSNRNVFLRKRQTTQVCVSTSVARSGSLTATAVASDGISPLMAQNARDQQLLMLWSGMWKGKGTQNLLRPRHVEGVCENIAKGTVRVGFWIGNCHGYGNADGYTGWNSVSRINVEEMPPPQA